MKNYFIYICNKCGSIHYSEEKGAKGTCSSCKSPLIETNISEIKWDQFTEEQRKDIIAKVTSDDYDYDFNYSSQETPGTNNNVFMKELVELTKGIHHDIHFIYVVLIIYILVSCVGFLFILLKLL